MIGGLLLMMKTKYVWLNMNTGEFSNSWDEETHDGLLDFFESNLEDSTNNGWKLIKYECLNDDDFDFYSMMKIVTNKP